MILNVKILFLFILVVDSSIHGVDNDGQRLCLLAKSRGASFARSRA